MDKRFIKNTSEIQHLMQGKNKIMLPPVIINLQKDVDRREKMFEHLKTFSIDGFIFPAVEKVSIPAAMQPGENACCLSHAAVLKCYHQQLDPNCERIAWLVLEDDARFVMNPVNAIVWTLLNIRSDWSIISLGCYNGDAPVIEKDEYSLVTKTSWPHWGSHAYLVNPKHARRIYLEMSALQGPVDHILTTEIHEGRGFITRPALTYQETFPSSLRDGQVKNIKAISDMIVDDRDYLLTL